MRTGEREEFLKAYDAYADAIYRHCFFRVYSRSRAEDLMQETFMRAWNYLVGGKKIENIRAFLYQVANNLIIDESRKKKEAHLEDLIAESPSLEPAIDSREEMNTMLVMRDVTKAMETLPPESRDLLIMRFIDDLDLKEIAKIMHTTANNVSVKIHRALEKMKVKFPTAQV